MELTREELQILILDSVNRRELLSEDVQRKCNLLQSLWEQKEKLSTDLLKLFESVSKCEAIVRGLYSKIGWEYKDDSEGNNCNDSASDSGATCDETDIFPVSNNIIAADSDEEQAEEMTEESSNIPEEKRSEVVELKRELRVYLIRLPMNITRRRAPLPSTSKREISDDEFSDEDSDYQPHGSSSDSDFSVSSTKSERQKKKKLIKLEKVIKTDDKEIPVSLRISSVQSAKSEPPANGTNGTTESAPKTKIQVKTETKPFAVSEKRPANALPQVPQELKVGMQVLAKRRKMIWESGKIAEIVEKEDGTQKFKVTFEDNGKMLVSGHHIAYDAMPKLVHLSVGGRVVSKYSSNNTFFTPGILGELPSRKNHMRFLIFFDDQRALYVALPVVRLVSKPLPDPLDDIRDEEHKRFMKEYLQRMPYPPHTQFRVGQRIKVERDGVLESCSVLLLDCSLMKVAYEKDEETEWIYRGSLRLEHIINMKEQHKK